MTDDAPQPKRAKVSAEPPVDIEPPVDAEPPVDIEAAAMPGADAEQAMIDAEAAMAALDGPQGSLTVS